MGNGTRVSIRVRPNFVLPYNQSNLENVIVDSSDGAVCGAAAALQQVGGEGEAHAPRPRALAAAARPRVHKRARAQVHRLRPDRRLLRAAFRPAWRFHGFVA